jgi:hypothetical protein
MFSPSGAAMMPMMMCFDGVTFASTLMHMHMHMHLQASWSSFPELWNSSYLHDAGTFPHSYSLWIIVAA